MLYSVGLRPNGDSTMRVFISLANKNSLKIFLIPSGLTQSQTRAQAHTRPRSCFHRQSAVMSLMKSRWRRSLDRRPVWRLFLYTHKNMILWHLARNHDYYNYYSRGGWCTMYITNCFCYVFTSMSTRQGLRQKNSRLPTTSYADYYACVLLSPFSNVYTRTVVKLWRFKNQDVRIKFVVSRGVIII